jgi:cobyrinic acid a,c-diamide synthase
MTRGIAPLVSGYLSFDSDVDIRGVILNNVGGPRHEGKLRAALERYTDTEVLGAIGRDRSLQIPERHLGLIPANEARQADAMIQQLAAAVTADVDVDRIIEIGATGKMPAADVPAVAEVTRPAPDIRIAIARDAAFGFYYPDDLDAFANAGAVLVPFDTLADHELPEADALFIGGGFPETHLTALAGNQDLLADIRQKLAAGMPAYAECGGLMYLARSIQWRDVKGDMVGAIAGDIVVGDRPQGRGYAMLEETGQGLWSAASGSLPVHEFHYSQLQNLSGNMDFCYRVLRGHGIDGQHDGLVTGNLLASFTHQRNTASNQWVERFLSFVRKARDNKD